MKESATVRTARTTYHKEAAKLAALKERHQLELDELIPKVDAARDAYTGALKAEADAIINAALKEAAPE